RGARPATPCSDQGERPQRAHHHPGLPSDQARTPVLVDDLRREQPRPGPPARLGPRALARATLKVTPPATAPQHGRQRALQAVAEPPAPTPGRSDTDAVGHSPLGPCQGPGPPLNRQQPWTHRVERCPPPGATRLEALAGLGFTDLARFERTDH